MWILNILWKNLILVLVIEGSLGIALGARTTRTIVTVALINVATNPAVVLGRLCLTLFAPMWEPVGISVLELLAFLVEGVAYAGWKTFGEKNPYLISLGLNLTTFGIGEIINLFL